MSDNFTFLKTIDKNLYEIISDAEKLYRDEYFEQSITQTRRFAESVCKKTLGDNYTGLNSFDEMLATLKDKSHGFEQEKEFIDDLYFLKQQGNLTAHSSKVNQNAIIALECLKRAFEVSINYSVYYKNQKNSILKLQYDVELLVTGKKNKSLAQRYSEKKIKKIQDKSTIQELLNRSDYKKNKTKKLTPITKKTNKIKINKTTLIKQDKKKTQVVKRKRTKKKKENKIFKTFITTSLVLALLIIFLLICFSKVYELVNFSR